MKTGLGCLALAFLLCSTALAQVTDPSFLKGKQALNAGDYDRAIELFGAFISKYPGDAEGYFQRGNAYASKKNYDYAIMDYDRALQFPDVKQHKGNFSKVSSAREAARKEKESEQKKTRNVAVPQSRPANPVITERYQAPPATISEPTARGAGPKSTYQWERIEGTDQSILYLDGRKLGVYDSKQDIYRKYESDGRLSDPVPAPWKKTSEATATTKAATPSPAATEEAPPRIPAWAAYAIGGGTAALGLLLFGVTTLLRKSHAQDTPE